MTDENEDRIDDLEFELRENLEICNENLNKEINKLKEDLNIWNKFTFISIPYTYEKFLKKGISFLKMTKFPQFIKEYRQSISPKKDIPFVINEKRFNNSDFRRDLTIKNTTFLKNAKLFNELGKSTTIDIKPILLYYSEMYLFSFFIHSFVIFDANKPGHGIQVHYNKNKNDIEITILKFGFFNRLVLTLSFFQYDSIFSNYLFDFNGDSGNRNIILQQNNYKFMDIEKKILLKDLISVKLEKNNYRYDTDIFFRIINNAETRFIQTSNLLRNFILIYVSGFLARYDPTKWKDIYNGETSDIFIPIQSSFEEINNVINFISDEFYRIKHEKSNRYSQTFRDIF